jgi:HSP20 family protein
MIATLTRRMNGNFWNPFEALRREVEGCNSSSADVLGVYPVDIHEDDNVIHVDAEMPGFKKDEIEVTFENGVLNIGAQRKADETKKGEAHLTERRYTRVARAFTLPNTVDAGQIEASLVDGVLHLKLHKRAEVKPRKIEVK